MIKNFYLPFFIPIFLTTFISIFFIPLISNSSSDNSLLFSDDLVNSTFSSFIWPTPGYSNITSKFGYRKAPTTGAGINHGGIDIGAPQNSSIIAIDSGVVSFVGWYGATGYTVIIEHNNNFKSIYGHVSPDFLVSTNEVIKKGQLIAKVGPKYVTAQSFTNYKDNTGKYTNGATTRAPSTFGNCKR